MGFRVNANGTVDSNPDVADLTAARKNDTKHTPTPWTAHPHADGELRIVDGDFKDVALVDGSEDGIINRHHAVHIVKCVNTHDGLVAERDRYMGWYYAEVTKRDELVAALRSLSDLSRAYIGHMDMDDLAALEAARTILAKVSK